MKSAFSYKRSLHQLGSANKSMTQEPQQDNGRDENHELISELSTTSSGTRASNSSENNDREQQVEENSSATSIANRLNKLQEINDVKNLSRTLSVQTLPQIYSATDQRYPESRPKTSISLNASVPFDEIPIKTRYSSTLSLGQSNTGSSLNLDNVARRMSSDKELIEFENNLSQSVAANLDKPEIVRPLQRNATEFIKSPKHFLKRGNRKIFPVTKVTTAMSHSPTKGKLNNLEISGFLLIVQLFSGKFKEFSGQPIANFERPREAYNNCIQQLDDPDWETVMIGLKNFVRLIRHHPEYIDPHIHLMAGIMSKHVRNLRSQVSRAACQATEEFFSTHRKQLETEADDLVTTLLHRTADTNKFLRKDATKALESMCDNLTTQKVINLLSTRGVTHQNALVRTTTSYLLCRLVMGMGADKVYALNKDSRDRVFLTGAKLLTEGSLETRNYAKQVFRELSTHIRYQKILLEVVPHKLYRHIEKTLKKVEK